MRGLLAGLPQAEMLPQTLERGPSYVPVRPGLRACAPKRFSTQARRQERSSAGTGVKYGTPLSPRALLRRGDFFFPLVAGLSGVDKAQFS